MSIIDLGIEIDEDTFRKLKTKEQMVILYREVRKRKNHHIYILYILTLIVGVKTFIPIPFL
jgi:hypothetical protein